jgi:hypothetical protein
MLESIENISLYLCIKMIADPKQICAANKSLYCVSSIEACTGVNVVLQLPICTVQCEPGKVRLGADTQPYIAEDTCVGKRPQHARGTWS